MPNHYTINWELSLICNLQCSFCSQKERREKNKEPLSLENIFSIIEHLPKSSHISFLWGETLMFPKILEVFQALETRQITYEFTTNGTLLGHYTTTLITLPRLKKITVSIDGYWTDHDRSRGKKWLFDTVIHTLPKITPYKPIAVSTVLTDQDFKSMLKLHILLDKLWISEHKLIYCMQFSTQDIASALEQIPELQIDSPGSITNIDEEYRKKFLQTVAILWWYEAKKIIFSVEPNWLFSDKETACKQVANQYRINDQGELSICEFISNSFGNIIKDEFLDSIQDTPYIAMKKKILGHFPLAICKTCCKNCIAHNN